MKSFLLACIVVSIAAFTACGGGSMSNTTPPPATYTISANVSGLNPGVTVVLQNNGGNDLTIAADGTFPFTETVSSGAAYSVSVKTQPSGQNCTLGSNKSGSATSNITVAVTCSTSFTISVAVTGLSGGSLVLQDSPSDQLTFTSNTTQTFATTYSSGTSYAVTLVSEPASQTCTPSSNNSGTITGNVTVTVTCVTVVTTDTLSVSVSGLTGTLVLHDSQNDSLTFTSNSTQTFATSYVSGSTYSVTVSTQPSGQTCTLSSNASGTISANTTVTATCTTNAVNYTISVAVTGLTGTLVVQDDKNDQLTFTTSNPQTFASQYASGSTYAVSIKTQPSGQTCTLSSNATGTITANTTVAATCTTNAVNYTISVAVSGLTGTLVVQDDKSDQLTFTTNTTAPFATAYPSGSTYSVTIKAQPSGQTCTLSSNASGKISSNITVTATCATNSGNPTISVTVNSLGSGQSVQVSDDKGDVLTFNSNTTLTFPSTYTSGYNYAVNVSSQPAAQACTPTYFGGTITSDVTLTAACATGATRALGTISAVSNITCQGAIKNGVCQQMTVSCPGTPDVFAYVKTNSPSGTSKGTVTYGTGTDGNGLYESIFTDGGTAVQNVLNAGFTTVQISWGTPFNPDQSNGWVQGPGGVLGAACRYATVTKWIYDNIQNNASLPMCATANSGGAGALAYALSQYGSSNILSMAEVTSGPPTGRLDWGCGCTQGSLPVSCGQTTTMGTCFGAVDSPVWDSAYTPSLNPSNPYCSNAAVNKALPPGGLNYFLGDSVEAPGATYNFPNTFVNLVFGGKDISSAIPIGQDWFNHITSTSKTGQECIADAPHAIADVPDGAAQIATDIINHCAK
jgi:hypothetical protein